MEIIILFYLKNYINLILFVYLILKFYVGLDINWKLQY